MESLVNDEPLAVLIAILGPPINVGIKRDGRITSCPRVFLLRFARTCGVSSSRSAVRFRGDPVERESGEQSLTSISDFLAEERADLAGVLEGVFAGDLVGGLTAFMALALMPGSLNLGALSLAPSMSCIESERCGVNSA